jgi:hypothetical protein
VHDTDKSFSVVYFGVNSIANTMKGNQVTMGFAERFKHSVDDSVKTFVIPQRTTDDIKMEILNPESVSEEKIEEMTNIYNQLLEWYEKSQRED